MLPRSVLELDLSPRRRELAVEVLAGLPDAIVYFLAALIGQIAWSLSRTMAYESAPIWPWLAALALPLAAFELAYAWPRRRGLRLRLDGRGLVAEVGGRTFTAGWSALRARDTGEATVLFFAARTPGLVVPHRLLSAAERALLAALLDEHAVPVAHQPLAAARRVSLAILFVSVALLAMSWSTITGC